MKRENKSCRWWPCSSCSQARGGCTIRFVEVLPEELEEERRMDDLVQQEIDKDRADELMHSQMAMGRGNY